MNRLSNAALAAAAFACLSSVASPVLAQEREPVKAHILVAGLAAGKSFDQKALEARVRLAAAHACGGDIRDLREMADASRCRAEMIADGQKQIAALQGSAQVKLAASDATPTLPR